MRNMYYLAFIFVHAIVCPNKRQIFGHLFSSSLVLQCFDKCQDQEQVAAVVCSPLQCRRKGKGKAVGWGGREPSLFHLLPCRRRITMTAALRWQTSWGSKTLVLRILLDIFIKCQVCRVVSFRERRTKCASMRVYQKNDELRLQIFCKIEPDIRSKICVVCR